MEVRKTALHGGSLRISSDVIAKIAKMATMEVEGVVDISLGAAATANGLLSRLAATKPINVNLSDGVADIEISVIVDYGVKIPELCRNVQKNVKHSVQNMTSITVASVNVVIAGVRLEEQEYSN